MKEILLIFGITLFVIVPFIIGAYLIISFIIMGVKFLIYEQKKKRISQKD